MSPTVVFHSVCEIHASGKGWKIKFALAFAVLFKRMFKVKKLWLLEVLRVDFFLNMVYETELRQIQTQETDPLKTVEKTAKTPFWLKCLA